MPSPGQDPFRFDREQLGSHPGADDFVATGPLAKAAESPEQFAKLDHRFQRINLTPEEAIYLLEAVTCKMGEKDLMANDGGALVADPSSFFYLVKFGVLILNGAYGLRPSVDDPASGSKFPRVREDFIEGSLRIAQEYRRIDLTENALKVLDLLNCISHGAEPRAESTRRIVL